MKCLSIRQPYASAIMAGLKTEEFRSWPTDHRGPLVIHASSNTDRAAFTDYPELDPADCPNGVLLGVVDLVACKDECVWFNWIVKRPRLLPEPIPYKGKLRLFDVDVLDPGPPAGIARPPAAKRQRRAKGRRS